MVPPPRSDVLFGRVASLLESEPAGYPLLLDALLPHVTSGRLKAPPPLIMQQLVTHLEQQDRLQVQTDTREPALGVGL